MTLNEARLILYARQGLALLPTHDQAMAAMVGVQTQYAQSLGQALSARSSEVAPLYEPTGLQPDGHLVKSWTLRGTVHTHTRDDFGLVVSAIGLPRYRPFRQFVRSHLGMSDDEYDGMETAALEALEEGPLTRKQLHERVPDLARTPFTGWGSDLKGLAYRGQISFIGKGADQRFARLHGFEPVEGAMDELARRYFYSFGPATAADLAYWLGSKMVDIRPVMKRILPELRPVEVEGTVRYVLGDPVPIEPRQAVLLAKFDPLTLAHRDKSLLFPPDHHKRIYRIAAQVEAVFLLHGEAAGTWRFSRRRDEVVVTLEPWRRLFRYEMKALDREAHRLARSVGALSAVLVLE